MQAKLTALNAELSQVKEQNGSILLDKLIQHDARVCMIERQKCELENNLLQLKQNHDAQIMDMKKKYETISKENRRLTQSNRDLRNRNRYDSSD